MLTSPEERARRSVLSFTTYTKPDYEVNWHHRVLCSYLDRFATGKIKRLLVFMPPRHGKSELVSRRLPAYILGRNPDAHLIACSYSADLASRTNRDVQRIIETDEYARLYPATKLFGANIRTVAKGAYLRNSDIFEVVGRRGFYRSAGVGGGITGMGFDFGIIDDPIKNREEADSLIHRETLWDWYVSTFYTRQERKGAILITLTRWHEDDLAGRLLNLMRNDPASDQWTIVNMPALAEPENAMPEDARAEDEALWPGKYDREALDKIRLTVGTHQWLGLYQQRPTAREGGKFKRAWFPIVDASPKVAQRVRYWDKAGSAQRNSDYSASVLMAMAPDGLFYVEDVVRGQWSSHQRNAIMLQTAQLDEQRYGNTVKIWTEQEPGSGGKESAETTVKLLAGFRVRTEPATGSKEVRSDPFAAQAEAGNVRLVRGDWNRDYIDELCGFPSGKHDDQVDASSGAFNRLTTGRRSFATGTADFYAKPTLSPRTASPARTPDEIEALLEAA